VGAFERHEAKQQQHGSQRDGARGEPGWLTGSIRVRIIDKKLRGGALYLKKGVIVGVHQPTVCDVYVADGGETITDVRRRNVLSVSCWLP
jgi:hypothetical protein